MKISSCISIHKEERSSSCECFHVVKLKSEHIKLCVVNPGVTFNKLEQ